MIKFERNQIKNQKPQKSIGPKISPKMHENCEYNEKEGVKTVATPGILSRVFLFYFEKISGHFSLFRVFWDVSVNTGRNSKFGRYEVCA